MRNKEKWTLESPKNKNHKNFLHILCTHRPRESRSIHGVCPLSVCFFAWTFAPMSVHTHLSLLGSDFLGIFMTFSPEIAVVAGFTLLCYRRFEKEIQRLVHSWLHFPCAILFQPLFVLAPLDVTAIWFLSSRESFGVLTPKGTWDRCHTSRTRLQKVLKLDFLGCKVSSQDPNLFTVVSWVELSWVFFCDQRLDSRPQIYSVPSVAPPPHFHLESDWVSFADPSLAAQLAGRNGLEGRPKTMHFLQCFPVLWWTTSRQIEAKPQSRILEKWMAPILHMFFFAIVAFVWGFWIFLQFSCSFLRYFFFWKSLKSTVFFLQLSFGETELVGFKVLCV